MPSIHIYTDTRCSQAIVLPHYSKLTACWDAKSCNITVQRLTFLQYLCSSAGCGFNFSIGEVSPYEVFRRAELRIHMKQPPGDQVTHVYLQLYHGSQLGSYKMVTPNREGWVVFDVLNDVQQWRAANHPHKKIHFYIVVYANEEDHRMGRNGKDCHNSPIKFHQPMSPEEDGSDATDDLQPLLMIYSHDLNAVKFNLTALIDAAESERSSTNKRRRSTSSEYSSTNSDATPTPNSVVMPSCGRRELQIDLDTFNRIWHLSQPRQTALFPTHFNLNICGGNCYRDAPLLSAQHPFILYYLYTREHAVPHNNTVWGQCCAPVKYKSIETLFSLPKGEVRIVTLKDMSVAQCSCLTILKRPDERRR